MKKSINSSAYDRKYYFNTCLGAEEFKKSHGKRLHPNVERLLSKLGTIHKLTILDLGCGRGDISLHLAKKAKQVVGIDYSKEAIEIAKTIRNNFSNNIQRKTKFYLMNAKKLNFSDNSFDLVVCIDVFEHLTKPELEKAMTEISRVLKKDGTLFVHTETNKIIYDVTYKYYIYPLNKLLTTIDKKIRNIIYPSLPVNPRTKEERKQHVNEPTYYYLKKIFETHHFQGKIDVEIGYVKPIKSFKTIIYNFFTTLYPLSKMYPLHLLFGGGYVCIMKNKKES